LEEKENATKQVVLNVDTEIENLKDKEIEFNKKIASLEGRITTLREIDLQNPLKEAIKQIISLGYAKAKVSDIISPDLDRLEIVADALGSKLDCLICDNIEQAETAIKYLQDNNLCKLSFIVLDKIPNDIQIQSSTDEAIELFKMLNCMKEYEKVGKFLSNGIFIKDNKVYGNAIVFGGGKSSSDKPVLVEEQIKKIQQEIEQLQKELVNINNEIEKKEDIKLNINLDNQKISTDKVRFCAQIENIQVTIKQRQADISDTTNEIEKLKQEKVQKQSSADTINGKVDDIENKLNDIEQQSASLNENVSKIGLEIDALRNQEEQAQQDFLKASTAFEKRNNDLQHRQQGQQYILDNITNLKSQIEKDTARLKEIDIQIQQVLNDQDTEGKNIQTYNQQMLEVEANLQVVVSKREEIQTNIDNKNITINEIRTKVDSLSSQVSALEGDEKAYIAQKNLLEQRIKETYNKTFDELKDEYLGVEVNREEIDRIKKKMESLGSVNLAAQEEYDQLSQRYNFIQTQQQDLSKAKKDLEDLIKKINETTVENFKKTFDIVRENFKNLYKKLFGGGDADLLLTDENNLLTTGVDIKAQPPGKLVKNILPCSGGEKALTAVALIFSFFLAKPSPFCILDEVEAPLDDANIGRYINVIREFSKNTQFLVVTHNKRTMEMADILYGVTMEQQGVSKIISVRMNRESEKEIDAILSNK
jgi:chromosome segregation protein